ncbi:MAG: 2-succinylbenzoate--CoA ligase [Actinomycetota bacterium]
MPSLIALDLAGGPLFVETLQRIWDEGHAVLPVDQRLPHGAKKQLIESMRPQRVVDDQGSQLLDNAQPVEPGDALVMATSGSTGEPKGVVLTHNAVEASALASSQALDADATDHWLACLPVAHIGGLSVITRALLTGIPVTVLPAFDAERVTALSHECTLTSLVSTALRRIDARLFRQILLGGGRPPADRPANTVATYGLTETGSGVVYDGFPLPGVEISIAADDEILVRGPMVMRTYRDGTTSIDAQGWLHTNDLGSLQPDGQLQVAGRRGDVINSGGQKIWPDAIEAVLSSALPTSEFCVVGIPDEEWGESVVLVTTNADLTLDLVRGIVKDSLAPYCAPRQLHVVSQIERTALGKVRRAEIRQQLLGLELKNPQL